MGSHSAHGPEGNLSETNSKLSRNDDLEMAEKHQHGHHTDSALAQIIGVAILEFGVALHRHVTIHSISMLKPS